MILVLPWETFSAQIDVLLAEANELSQRSHSVKKQEELQELRIEIDKWRDKCHAILKTSFDEENNEFAKAFYSAYESQINLGNQSVDFSREKRVIVENFKAKERTLAYFQKILSVSDAIIRSDNTNLTERSSYDTNEILGLILEKLYDLYDNYYYSVLSILDGNGIVLKKPGEDRELAAFLYERGYIDVSMTKNVTAKLTLHGKMFVEEHRKAYTESYENINNNKEEIETRIDEIIDRLTKLGYGQEILFEELQELKELSTTLNKKNWGQLVKGKLVDLGLAKLVENDTLKIIYKALTDLDLRLP